jgi:hypothetical protein
MRTVVSWASVGAATTIASKPRERMTSPEWRDWQLRPDCLADALADLAMRHEVLRTTIEAPDAQLRAPRAGRPG